MLLRALAQLHYTVATLILGTAAYPDMPFHLLSGMIQHACSHMRHYLTPQPAEAEPDAPPVPEIAAVIAQSATPPTAPAIESPYAGLVPMPHPASPAALITDIEDTITGRELGFTPPLTLSLLAPAQFIMLAHQRLCARSDDHAMADPSAPLPWRFPALFDYAARAPPFSWSTLPSPLPLF